MCTLLPSDWVVKGSDWFGFRMFPREPSVFKAWNEVRVPPWAQQVPSSEGIFALNVYTCVLVSSDARPGLCGVPVVCSVLWVSCQVSWLQALSFLGLGG